MDLPDLGLAVDRPWLLLLLVPAAVPLVAALRRLRGPRARASSTLRAVGLTALALALAGVAAERPRTGLAVVLAVDDSVSVGGRGVALAEQVLGAARDELAEGDRVGVVVFGGDAVVDATPAPPGDVGPVQSRVERRATDAARALALAEALFPDAARRRAVLVSDGRETSGSVARAAALAGARGVEVSAVPVDAGGLEEALVVAVELPPQVLEGEVFPVAVTVRSTVPQQATVRLLVEDRPFGAQPVALHAGQDETVTFRVHAGASGIFRLRALLEAPHDTYPGNDVVSTFVRVAGEPRVLVLAGDPAGAAPLVASLTAAGLGARLIGAADAYDRVTDLAPYAAVVLDDVAATDLSDASLEALRRYVHDLGGGLLMIGGERSFGPGGWYRTAVEAALPVTSEVKSKRYRAPIALVIAIDRSGSMAGVGGDGLSKVDLAKQAAVGVLEVLEPDDEVGVVAFDSAASWVAPLAPAARAREQVRAIGTLSAGGGTDFTPALDTSYRALEGSGARVRHVLLITDGHSVPGNQLTLARRAARDGITLSTVAIGTDADLTTLQGLAKQGGGRYYQAREATRLPRIFVREAVLAARSHVIEEPFEPRATATSELTRAITDARPTLGGYVATTARPRARVLLETHRDEPLLATWRYGLGRSAAYTSDDGARWAQGWAGSPGYGELFSGLVRWTLRESDSPGLVPTAQVEGDDLRVAVDAYTPDGGFRNFATLWCRIVPPDGEPLSLPLTQTAPGRYEGLARGAPWPGALVRIERWEHAPGDEGALPVEVHTAPAPAVAPAELRRFGADRALLREAAARTGGRLVEPDAGFAALFERAADPSRERLPLTRPLLTAALVLLILDVAARRLSPPRVAWLGRRARRASTRRTRAAARPDHATTGARAAPQPDPTPVAPAAAPGRDSPGGGAESDGAAPTGPAAELDYTGRLLAAKRRSREKTR